jgi:hypothetical protein
MYENIKKMLIDHGYPEELIFQNAEAIMDAFDDCLARVSQICKGPQ